MKISEQNFLEMKGNTEVIQAGFRLGNAKLFFPPADTQEDFIWTLKE